MTISILDILGILPSGLPGARLTLAELGVYLRQYYNTEEERDRNARHVVRDQMFRDGGVQYMKSVIDDVFTKADVAELRKKFVKHARSNNPLKRVVNEISTVYAEPAKRTVANDDQKYQDLLTSLDFDERMYQMSKLLNLHRALLVGFRVRERPDGTREPVLDVATPASVRAVMHPNDSKEVIAWIIRTDYRSARPTTNAPRWVLWTDHERVQLRDDMSPIEESYKEHGLGVNPWVGVCLSPECAGWWPGEEGEDLVAATTSVWLVSVLMLKETKSTTKQHVISGDTTTMAREQSLESEGFIEAPDGTSISSLDMGVDVSTYHDTSDHVVEHVAQNYGMSAALINQQGVQSAEARELMRLPLREMRVHQQVPLRRFEATFVIVMAAVLNIDLPDQAFDPEGWRMEFGEAQAPVTREKDMDLFLKGRGAGVDDTIEFILRQHPGMTREEAMAELERHVAVETYRNLLMRPLAAISGANGGGGLGSPPAAPAPAPTAAADQPPVDPNAPKDPSAVEYAP